LVSRIYTTWFLSKEDKVVYWDCYGDDKGTLGLYATSFKKPGRVESFAPLDPDSYHLTMYPSPDGDKLAYGGYCTNFFVYDFTTQGINEYDLCEINSYIWTPDGKNILYNLQICSDQQEDVKIHMLSLETGESTVLAEGYLYGKAFGPGGSSTYYLKEDKQTKLPCIWRINLDGTNDTKIFPVEGIEYVTVHPTPVLKWAERD
jgi:Tol biopolymer transport system component